MSQELEFCETSTIYMVHPTATTVICRGVLAFLILLTLVLFLIITIRASLAHQLWKHPGLLLFYSFLGLTLLFDCLYYLSGVLVCPSRVLYMLISMTIIAFKDCTLLLLTIRVMEMLANIRHINSHVLTHIRFLLYALLVLHFVCLYVFAALEIPKWTTSNCGTGERCRWALRW